jgi:Aerotolerance regulator N-terminal
MSFQAPIFLLGLAVVPLALAALAVARRRPARYVVRFPAVPTLAAVAPRSPRWRRLLPPALLCLALAGLALALARPETTVAVQVDSAAAELRRAFASAELERRDALKAALRRARARHVALSAADHDWLRTLGRALR